MTALMHCAYRGNSEACSVLLKKGADVNSSAQQSGVRLYEYSLLNSAKITINMLCYLAVYCTDVCHNCR